MPHASGPEDAGGPEDGSGPEDGGGPWTPPHDWASVASAGSGKHQPGKYQQVASQLSRMIDRRRPGEQLPPEQQLARLFRVSHMTIRRAMEVLSQGGRIRAERGRGTFVADSRVTAQMSGQSFTQAMRAQGRVPSSRVMTAERATPSTSEADALALGPDDRVLRIRRLRLGDDVPMCVETTTLPAERFDGLLDQDLTGSLYALLQQGFATTVHPRSSLVRAHSLDESQAALLDQPSGAAAIRSQVIGVDDDGVPIESTVTICRGDLYQLLFTLTDHKET
ncbi:MAG TPA: GntR family transcriptional regulator [Candidatus Avipropionibacterium avicola]|uniref:GntR family transcriptional regulator n=1 Tax=Candidatus Avipropionibacterium avicola TaxID=2840701 RepID=A0A9D1KM13_9ACTN|nr:GntR family transcriptional regulator [Candidatus Avipropionibacterium avicola]